MAAVIVRLEDAVSAGRLDEALVLLKENPDLLWTELSHGMSAVVTALHKDRVDVAQEIGLRVLEAIRAGQVPRRHLYGAIHDLGEAWHTSVGGGWQTAEAEVSKFLKHEDEALRYIAINVLGLHWDARSHVPEFAHHLQHDPDIFVRGVAASALGSVLDGSRDPEATEVLLKRIRDQSEDGLVRDSSYGALLEIWLGWEKSSKITIPRLLQSRTREFDARFDELREERDRAIASGDEERIAELDRRMDSVLADMENEWTRTVDWDMVDKIERGEAPGT